MKAYCLLFALSLSQAIHLGGHKKKVHKDAFDQTIGGGDSLCSRGYDEVNDYDKEVERPENVQWDDDSWKGFKADFEQLEKDDFAPVLNEKQLMS